MWNGIGPRALASVRAQPQRTTLLQATLELIGETLTCSREPADSTHNCAYHWQSFQNEATGISSRYFSLSQETDIQGMECLGYSRYGTISVVPIARY
jgi:hypothetical protein